MREGKSRAHCAVPDRYMLSLSLQLQPGNYLHLCLVQSHLQKTICREHSPFHSQLYSPAGIFFFPLEVAVLHGLLCSSSDLIQIRLAGFPLEDLLGFLWKILHWKEQCHHCSAERTAAHKDYVVLASRRLQKTKHFKWTSGRCTSKFWKGDREALKSNK